MMLIFARRMLKLTFCEMGSSGMIDQVVDGFYPRKFELEVSQSSADRQEPNPENRVVKPADRWVATTKGA
jgi:hypothetical protein